jgi:hypothetical protein
MAWMARFSKKNVLDIEIDSKQHRMQRKIRGHKLSSSDKFEKRHSWGYAKRRALLTE